jgi:hypothetical protein
MVRPLTSQIVIDKFASIIDSQDEKGLKKYGTSIDGASNLKYNWELMALEETADLQKYLVKRIMQLKSENRFKSKWINELQVKNGELLHRHELLEQELFQANNAAKQQQKEFISLTQSIAEADTLIEQYQSSETILLERLKKMERLTECNQYER